MSYIVKAVIHCMFMYHIDMAMCFNRIAKIIMKNNYNVVAIHMLIPALLWPACISGKKHYVIKSLQTWQHVFGQTWVCPS